MASKKRPGRSPSHSGTGRTEILLEDFRSQVAAAIEGVQVAIHVEGRRVDERLGRVDKRLTDLEGAVRGHSTAIHRMDASLQQNTADIQRMDATIQRMDGDIQRMDGNVQRMDAKLDRKADATLVARVEVLEQRGQP